MPSSKNRAAVAALVAAAAGLAGRPPAGRAETFQPTTGTTNTWNSAANWSPASIPNGVGASAVFNGAATANNPAQTGNRTATLDVPITVGSITFNNDLSTFTNSITTGTNGALTLDAAGAGPATINVPAAAGTGNNTISVATTLNDTLVATVDNVTASSAAGALNLTATMTGAGGFTKLGDGLATFGTGAKTYAGPTVLNGGRMRVSQAAEPANTSGFTVNAGAQLDLISGSSYTFGGPLNLNGVGATTGPFAVFPGAIRNDTGLVVTVTNPVVLQSNTLLHVQATGGTGNTASPTGSLTFSGPVSGPGKLTLTAPTSNIDQGTLSLAADNSYAGGTLVAGGILAVSGVGADLGTGNVTVDNASSPSSIARLSITSGVANAIADAATLTIAGGGTAGTADQNFVILGSGVNERVAGLVLGTAAQTVPGTYGATGSGATFVNDEYFSGPGVVTLAPVPEPAGACLLTAAGVGLLAGRRRRHS